MEEGWFGGLRKLGLVLKAGLFDGLVELDLQDNFLAFEGAKALAGGIDRPGALPKLQVRRGGVTWGAGLDRLGYCSPA